MFTHTVGLIVVTTVVVALRESFRDSEDQPCQECCDLLLTLRKMLMPRTSRRRGWMNSCHTTTLCSLSVRITGYNPVLLITFSSVLRCVEGAFSEAFRPFFQCFRCFESGHLTPCDSVATLPLWNFFIVLVAMLRVDVVREFVKLQGLDVALIFNDLVGASSVGCVFFTTFKIVCGTPSSRCSTLGVSFFSLWLVLASFFFFSWCLLQWNFF